MKIINSKIYIYIYIYIEEPLNTCVSACLEASICLIIIFQMQNKCFVGIDYTIYYVGCDVRYSQGKYYFFSFKPLLYGWMSYYLRFPILSQ